MRHAREIGCAQGQLLQVAPHHCLCPAQFPKQKGEGEFHQEARKYSEWTAKAFLKSKPQSNNMHMEICHSGVIKTLHIQGRGVPSSPMQFCITSSLSSANLFDAAITDTYLTKVLAQPLIVSQDYLYIINLFFPDFTSANRQKNHNHCIIIP